MNKKILRVFSVLMVAGMILTFVPSYADDYEDYDGQTVTLRAVDETFTKVEISTMEDMINLSKRCLVDANSDNLYVRLKNDISLEGIEFSPIPFFNGIFDGNGHEITGLSCKNIAEPVGLFSTIGENGLVKDLKVSGNLQPSENCNYIGSIAGENRGTIYNCSFAGVVTGDEYVGGIVGRNALTGKIVKVKVTGAVRGDNMTGGIAGINNGSIIDARNEALINTESVDASLDIDSMEFSLDLTKLSTQKASTSQDMGGIAGYSSGIISKCENMGEVGFHHQGYNIGGIAGRSSGHIYASINRALVTGRKDIGGIVGQMEPYIMKTLSESQISILNTQISDMQGLVTKTKNDAVNAGNTINSRINSLNDQLYVAEGNASELAKSMIGEHDLSIDKKEVDDETSLEDRITDATGQIKDKVTEEKEQYKDNVNLIKENELYNSLTDVNTQIELLNKEAKGYSDKLDSDLNAINNQYSAIKDTILSVQDNEYGINDTSVINPELVILGAVRRCTNEGAVEGDLNAGGIAGVMGEESSVDPEDEISLKIDVNTHTEYEYKAVMDTCVNEGSVTVKRNYAGGLVARAEVGYIMDCENYGIITADGNYVGGVAGSAGITINNCYVKAHLNGNKYIGGIIGEGVNKKADETGSLVANCRALVSIDTATKFYGAIAATPDGEYKNNIYTSDTLAGLGSYSKAEEAYPVSYNQLKSGDGVPSEFKKIKVIFKADSSVLKEMEVRYGGSVNANDYPELPSKKGCYSRWDNDDLTNIVADEIVNVEYCEYVESLSSDVMRTSDRPIFYVAGDFTDSDVLTVENHGATALSASDNNFLADLFYRREVEEEWTVDIPKDGRSEHDLRYLPTDISSKDNEIYINEDGTFTKADFTKIGSYLSMNVASDHVIVAVISSRPVYLAFVISVVITITLVALIVVIVIMRRKLKSAQREKEEAIAKKELDEDVAPKPVENIRKVKFKKLRLIINIIRIVLLLLIVVLSVFLAKKPQIVSEKINKILLEKIEKDTSTQLSIELEVNAGDKDTVTECYLWNEKVNDSKVSCLEIKGINIYKCKDVLWLDNGRAFEVSELVPDYGSLYKSILEALKDSELSYKKVDGGTEHTIVIKGDKASVIMSEIMGDATDELALVDSITIVMFSSNFNIEAINIKGIAHNETGDRVTVNCKCTVVPKKLRKSVSVPKVVANAITEGAETTKITKETLSLFYAIGEFSELDPAMCDIGVNIIGGVASVSDDFTWYRQKVKDEWINCVTRNGISLYFNEKGSCTSKGVSLTDAQAAVVNSAKVLEELMDIALRNAVISAESNKSTVLRITLDDEDIMRLISLAAPDLTELDKSINSGEIIVTVTDGELSRINLELKGTVKVLLLNKAFEINVTATPKTPNASVDYSVPLEVSGVLAGK